MNNKKILITLTMVAILCFIFNNIVKATESKDINNCFKIVDESNYSTEYKKWLALSDDEKNNYIMPLMYNIDFNIDELKDNSDITSEASTLPEKYCLKDSLNINVRNQQNTDFCWAFAASKVFETTYAKLNNKTSINELSPRHMVYATSRYFNNNIENPMGFNKTADGGGNYMQSIAYWANGSGPVLEKDMPFVNSMEKINISEIQNKTVQAQLEDATIFPNIYKSYDSSGNITYSNGNGTTYTKNDIETFRNMIKMQIMKYGAVGTMTHMPIKEDRSDLYYSSDYMSYYCNNTLLSANHGIVIVGWDDTYSKTNFKEDCQPINDGAYIVLNSYGDFNSNGGYYYISYDDYFVENVMFGIQGISDVDYDNIYQYDELGLSYYLYGKNSNNQNVFKTIYAANCFKKQSSFTEKLSEVGVYIYNNGTDVTIYLNKDSNNLDISKLDVVANAENLNTGYHIIKLNDKKIIENDFSIVVKYSNNAGAIIPVEMPILNVNDNELYETSSANLGESFASFDGISWIDITSINGYNRANACIKAFTINEKQNSSDTDYIKNKNLKIINGTDVKMISGIEEKTAISELLSTNNFSNEYIIKAYKNGSQVTAGNVTTGTVIKIFEGSNLVQEYTVVIYGDTTGDGNIQSSDALLIVKNALNTATFKNEIYLEAGRVTLSKRNARTQPTAVDALACVKHKLGLSTIAQY